jgi:hypothetical protein
MTGLSSGFRSGAPLEFSLPLLERLRLGIPKMKTLWEVSSLQMSGRDNAFQNYLWFEEDVRKELDKGTLTMKTSAKPESDARPNWT